MEGMAMSAVELLLVGYAVLASVYVVMRLFTVKS